MQRVTHLGHGLFDIGGENVAHVLYHEHANTAGAAAGSTSVITDYWCDDSWDVQRRRQLTPTSRVTVHP
jgi:hypothetical protein